LVSNFEGVDIEFKKERRRKEMAANAALSHRGH
jgi:hypothetical protein